METSRKFKLKREVLIVCSAIGLVGTAICAFFGLITMEQVRKGLNVNVVQPSQHNNGKWGLMVELSITGNCDPDPTSFSGGIEWYQPHFLGHDPYNIPYQNYKTGFGCDPNLQ